MENKALKNPKPAHQKAEEMAFKCKTAFKKKQTEKENHL